MKKSVLIVGVLSVVAAACEQERTLSPDTLAPVKVGVVASLSGGLRDLGPGWMNAAALAVNEINAGGGVLPGRRVELVVADDETNPDTAERAARQLIEVDGVVGIVGGTGSSMALGIDSVAGPASVPQISGTSTSPALNADDGEGGDVHPFFFRTVPSDDLQGWVLASLAYGEISSETLALECRRLALIHLDDDYGGPLANTIRDRFVALGGEISIVVPLEDGLPTYQDEVHEVIDAAPDCIALVSYPESGGTIVREWHRYGGSAEAVWIGTEGIRGPGFCDEAGDQAIGMIGTAAASDPYRGELEIFTNHYEATFEEEPVTLAEAVYDAMALLLLAIGFAGSTDGEDLQGALIDVANRSSGERTYGPGALVDAMQRIDDGNSVDYEGAVGSADLLINGDVVTDFEVWEYDGVDFLSVMSVGSTEIHLDGGD